MKPTWNRAVLTEDPFLIWSDVIRDSNVRILSWLRGHWSSPPVPQLQRTERGNFAAVLPAVIFKQGHCCVLTLILYFHSVMIYTMFSSDTSFSMHIQYIKVSFIFFYIYVIYSWEWCGYVIILLKSNYVHAEPFLKNSHLQWGNCSCHLSLWIVLLSTRILFFFVIHNLDGPWRRLHVGRS